MKDGKELGSNTGIYKTIVKEGCKSITFSKFYLQFFINQLIKFSTSDLISFFSLLPSQSFLPIFLLSPSTLSPFPSEKYRSPCILASHKMFNWSFYELS